MNQDDERAELVNRVVDSLDFPDAGPEVPAVSSAAPPAVRSHRSLFVNIVVFLVTLVSSVLLGHDGHGVTSAHRTGGLRPADSRR